MGLSFHLFSFKERTILIFEEERWFEFLPRIPLRQTALRKLSFFVFCFVFLHTKVPVPLITLLYTVNKLT